MRCRTSQSAKSLLTCPVESENGGEHYAMILFAQVIRKKKHPAGNLEW